MAAKLQTIIDPDGRVRVDLFLPLDAGCDETDAEMRAILDLLGAGFQDPKDDPRPPDEAVPVPEGAGEKTRG